jgi:NADPH:quinone reductase-like Zn-dependent oxidoreductase
LIKIIRAGLNPVDWKRATFAAREDFAFPGYIGVDGFGIVVAKGSKVSEEYVMCLTRLTSFGMAHS